MAATHHQPHGLPTSRHECKYFLPERQVADLRQFMQPFMKLDSHGMDREGGRYPIVSLYLDTPDFKLHHQTLQGVKNRFKLRVRTYSDDPGGPVFFEIKRRVDKIIIKHRAKVSHQEAQALLSGSGAPFIGSTDKFMELSLRLKACPVVRVRYDREAYVSRSGDSVRITIDSHLTHQKTLDPLLAMGGEGWQPTPVEGHILEIKFTERYPAWVQELIRAFELQRISIPKYVLSVKEAFGSMPRLDPLGQRLQT
ncbi:MAG: polyphosphate polymerase domain-containing protein [Magnetococcales bacterium]|nr:polyphosphate polymerase domain-containing protein [Magnetococcales bacterium]